MLDWIIRQAERRNTDPITLGSVAAIAVLASIVAVVQTFFR